MSMMALLLFRCRVVAFGGSDEWYRVPPYMRHVHVGTTTQYRRRLNKKSSGSSDEVSWKAELE